MHQIGRPPGPSGSPNLPEPREWELASPAVLRCTDSPRVGPLLGAGQLSGAEMSMVSLAHLRVGDRRRGSHDCDSQSSARGALRRWPRS